MNSLQGASLEPHLFSTKKLGEAQLQTFDARVRVASEDFIKVSFNRLPPRLLKREHPHVVFTSKNAVESLLTNIPGEALQFGAIYCVGRKTKRFIQRKIGPVAHMANNAKDLATHLADILEPGMEVTYFRGNLSLPELPDILEGKDIAVNAVLSYETKLSGQRIPEGVVGVLFYSPSTVESYLKNNRPNKVAYCIGETTAKVARKYFETVKVAKIPDTDSLMALANAETLKAL